MLEWLFYIIIGILSMMGLLYLRQLLLQWLWTGWGDGGTFLVLNAQGDDPAIEMKIRRAAAQAAGGALKGTQVVVVDSGANGETIQICHRLCASQNIPLLAPSEFLEKLTEMPEEG